jgi:hypothetical protein
MPIIPGQTPSDAQWANVSSNMHLAPQALVGEIDEPEEPQDNFTIAVDLRKMTWGDNMVHVRFQLLVETIGDDAEDADPKAKIAALRELLAGFDELTEYLNRVATVTRNGVKINSFNKVPMDMVKEVMDAISKAQRRQGKPKN